MKYVVKSKQELLEKFNQIVNDSTDDSVIEFMGDLSDTIDSNENENWKQKYNDLDVQWRKKYKERFMNKNDKDDFEEEDELERPKKYSFNDLFKGE